MKAMKNKVIPAIRQVARAARQTILKVMKLKAFSNLGIVTNGG